MSNHRGYKSDTEAQELQKAILRFTNSAQSMRHQLAVLSMEAKKEMSASEWYEWLDAAGIPHHEGEALVAYAESMAAPSEKKEVDDWVRFLQAV